MKKKFTAVESQGLMNAIGSADLKKMSGIAKVELTRVLIALRPLARSLDDARQEALERLTDGHDEQNLLERMISKDETLTADEMEKARAWEQELKRQLNEALKDVAEEEHEVNITPPSDRAIGELYDALPNLNTIDMMFIQEHLGCEETTESDKM